LVGDVEVRELDRGIGLEGEVYAALEASDDGRVGYGCVADFGVLAVFLVEV
jgi:hypothetical protein